MDLTQPTYRYHDGGQTAEATAREIAKLDSNMDKETGNLILKSNLNDDKEAKKVCKRLAEKSRNALKNYAVPQNTEGAIQEAGTCETGDCKPMAKNLKDQAHDIGEIAEQSINHSGYPKVFSQTCSQCHDSEFNIAPNIPFSSPVKMKNWLNQGGNKEKLKSKILSPDETQRMPPTRLLTDDEINDVLKFLNKEP